MNSELEYALLSATLNGEIDPELVTRRLAGYEFECPEAQIIFDEMDSFIKKEGRLNRLLIKNKCGTSVSDETWLYVESNDDVDEDSAVKFLDVLLRKAYQNKLKKLCRIALSRADAGEDPDEVHNDLQNRLNNLEEADSNKVSKTMKELSLRFLNNLKERINSGEEITGLATSFNDLDKMTTGLHPGDLIVVAGRPAMGKTTLAINIGEAAALRGKRVKVYSFEMPADQLFQRNVASIGSIDYTHIKNGKFTEMEASRLPGAIKKLQNLDMEIDDSSGLDIYELRKRVLKHNREKKIDLVIIDYLQLMKMAGNSENRSQQIADITTGLKALAKDLGIPIILLSQLNRSLEQRPNKRPVNADLRESGAIEQDADMIVFVYRDEVYNSNSPDIGIAEIIIGKQRSGPIGTVRLKFKGKYSRFENISEPIDVGSFASSAGI